MNQILFNCPNCGAPIKNYKCEYCDTIFHQGWTSERIEEIQRMKIEYYKEQIKELTKQFCQADLETRNKFLNYNIKQSLQYRGGI